MNENVTVEEAISKAKKYLDLPIKIFGIGLFLLLFLNIIYHKNNSWIIFVGYFPVIIIIYLWQKYATTKWQFWAFENVRNVHELKKAAIQNEIIKPNKSIFEQSEKFEIKHKSKLDKLRKKFELEDVFNEDLSIPFETKIFYNKSKMFFFFSFNFIFFCFLIFVSLQENTIFIIALIFLILSIYYLIRFLNYKPQIIINNKGISTKKTSFYNWKEIENEEVITDRQGRAVNYYLIYNHPNGNEKLNIGNFNTNNRKLNKLLILYRGRYKKMNNL